MASVSTGEGKITVLSMTWAANQPKLVEIEHHVPAGSSEVLAISEQFIYVDTDLGEIFNGRIHDIKKVKRSGSEGINYSASDLGRTLQKQPCRFLCSDTCPDSTPGTTKCHIDGRGVDDDDGSVTPGTLVEDAIEKVVESIQPSELNLLNELTIAASIGDLDLLEDLDKAGQSIAEWLDSILEQTDGGVWYTHANDLFVYDYYAAGSINLLQGTLANLTANPKKEGKPLLESAEVGDSTNGKFGKVTVEGKGKFQRFECTSWNYGDAPVCSPLAGEWVPKFGDNDIVNGGIDIDPAAFNKLWNFSFRWYPAHSTVLDAYLDAKGKCAKGIFLSFEIDYENQAGPQTGVQKDLLVQLVQDNNDTAYDTGSEPNPRKGWYYVEIELLIGKVLRPDPPTLTSATLRYTAYIGPLVSQVTAGAVELEREGEFVAQRPDCYYYLQPEVLSQTPLTVDGHDTFPVIEIGKTIDMTSVLDDEAASYVNKYLNIDVSGKLVLNISSISGGLISTIKPGTVIDDLGENCRVRSLKYDFINRSLEIEVSSLPLRDFMRAAKDRTIDKSKKKRNWAMRETKEPDDCFTQIILNFNCRCTDCTGAPVPTT